jgi:excisionase family DNA binding protein
MPSTLPPAAPLDLNELLSLTIDDCARRTGFSRPLLYRLLAAGKLRSFKMGKRRYIDAGSLRELIAELKSAEARPPPPRGKDGRWYGPSSALPHNG